MHVEGFARCKLVDPSRRRVKNVGSCRGIYLSSRSLGEVAGGGYLAELIRVAGRLRWRLTAAPLTWCLQASSPTILWLLWPVQLRARPCAVKDGDRAPGVMLPRISPRAVNLGRASGSSPPSPPRLECGHNKHERVSVGSLLMSAPSWFQACDVLDAHSSSCTNLEIHLVASMEGPQRKLKTRPAIVGFSHPDVCPRTVHP